MMGEGRVFLEIVLLRVDPGAVEGFIACGGRPMLRSLLAHRLSRADVHRFERVATGWMNRREAL